MRRGYPYGFMIFLILLLVIAFLTVREVVQFLPLIAMMREVQIQNRLRVRHSRGTAVRT
jgi:hypothetical protein